MLTSPPKGANCGQLGGRAGGMVRKAGLADPYWSEELLAVLVAVLGDEERARDTLEDIIRQACEGKALQTLSAEGLGAPRI